MAEEVSVSSSGVEMEGADNFKVDLQDMIDNIKQGYGYIDPEYVEQTWEMSSEIPFASVKDKVLSVLSKMNLLKSDIDEAIGEKNFTYKDAKDKEKYVTAGDIDGAKEKVKKFGGDINSVKEKSTSIKEAGDYEYRSAEEFDLDPQEGPNDPLGPDAPKYPRADFADAVYAANQAGLSKDELIRLVNQNAK